MSDTQQQINYYINQLKDIRGEVSNLLMPVRYFKTLNILPKSLVDEEIINKNFDEEWLHKTYCETTSNCHIKSAPAVRRNEADLHRCPYCRKRRF